MTDQVRADIDGKRILLISGYEDKDLCQEIPGKRAKWDKTGPKDRFIGWTYPLAWSSCVALRQTFGDRLVVGRSLTQWAWSEHARREQMEDLRSGAWTELSRVEQETPELYRMLQNRPFQLAGTRFIVEGNRVCLGDEPRLGKTYQALAALVQSDARTILIACPKTACYSVWQKKIREFLGEEAYVAQEGRANREQVMLEFANHGDGRRILVINKEMVRIQRFWRCLVDTNGKPTTFRSKFQPMRKQKPGRKGGCRGMHKHDRVEIPDFPDLFRFTWDAVILDECHHLLASEKNVQSDDITQSRLGAMRLNVPDGMKLALSGTPFRSTLTKSWGVLNWLRPDVFTSFWQFAERHFPVTDGRYGKEIDRTRLKDPAKFDEEIRPFYLARTKAQVAPQLPPVDYVDVILPMEGKQEQAYQKMTRDAEATLEGGRITATGVLAELTRLRQFASAYGKLGDGRKVLPALPSNKLEWVEQFLEEREAQQSKVVIASVFTELVNLFATALIAKGYSVAMITGATSGKRRAEVMDEFLNDTSLRICIINTFAGGEAIDLGSADELIMLDEPWTDDPKQQAENRIVDLSKDRQLTVFRLRSEGTIEEDIAEMTDEQRRILFSAKPQARELLREIVK